MISWIMLPKHKRPDSYSGNIGTATNAIAIVIARISAKTKIWFWNNVLIINAYQIR